MSRARTTTRQTSRKERRPDGTLPAHPPRDWQAVAPLAGDLRGRMCRSRSVDG